MQGAQHAHVVELVLNGGLSLKLRVLRLDDAEIARLQRLEDALEEKKPGRRRFAASVPSVPSRPPWPASPALPLTLMPRLPCMHAEGRPAGNMATISVEGYREVRASPGVQAHTVFHVHVDGQYRCSKRYSDMERLHQAVRQAGPARFYCPLARAHPCLRRVQLKARFKWFTFPAFPGKKMNGLVKVTLAASDLESRRQGLDAYLSYGIECRWPWLRRCFACLRAKRCVLRWQCWPRKTSTRTTLSRRSSSPTSAPGSAVVSFSHRRPDPHSWPVVCSPQQMQVDFERRAQAALAAKRVSGRVSFWGRWFNPLGA